MLHQGSDNQFLAITIWAASPAKADAKFSWLRVTSIRVGRLAFRWFCWFFWGKRRGKNGCMSKKRLNSLLYIKKGPFLRQTWNSHLPWPKKQTLKHEKRGMLRLRNVDLPKAHFQSCVPTKINGRSKTPPLWQLSRMQVKRHPAGKGRTKVWNSLGGTRRRRPEGSFFNLPFPRWI